MFTIAHLHPMLVHFPIALILAGFLLDFFSMVYKKEQCLSKAGFYLMILGVLGTLAAYFSGEFLTVHPTEGEVAGVFDLHETFAYITLFTMIGVTLLRVFFVVMKNDRKPVQWLIFCLTFLAAVSVAITGYLGGTVVYNYYLTGF